MSVVNDVNIFFEHDENIKKAMIDMAPPTEYLYDRTAMEDYRNKIVIPRLDFIISEFKEIASINSKILVSGLIGMIKDDLNVNLIEGNVDDILAYIEVETNKLAESYDPDNIEENINNAHVLAKDIGERLLLSDAKIGRIFDIIKMIEEKIHEILYIRKLIDDLLNQILYESDCGYDGDKLRDFYQKRISDMDPKLITTIAQGLHAGYVSRPVGYCIGQCKTINELLHVIHSNIVNDNLLFRSNELINQDKIVRQVSGKEYKTTCTISLYGKKTGISSAIFYYLHNIMSGHKETQCDIIDVFSVSDDKILILLRGLGHSTSIEINMRINEQSRLEFDINYFIPKICDFNMISDLEGIKNVRPESEEQEILRGAQGSFKSSFDELFIKLNDLITHIPGDYDLNHKEDKGYHRL